MQGKGAGQVEGGKASRVSTVGRGKERGKKGSRGRDTGRQDSTD